MRFIHALLKESGDLYWRILEDEEEIEVVLKVKTQSFAAVGWKPNDITRSCQSFPKLKEYEAGKICPVPDMQSDNSGR